MPSYTLDHQSTLQATECDRTPTQEDRERRYYTIHQEPGLWVSQRKGISQQFLVTVSFPEVPEAESHTVFCEGFGKCLQAISTVRSAFPSR